MFILSFMGPPKASAKLGSQWSAMDWPMKLAVCPQGSCGYTGPDKYCHVLVKFLFLGPFCLNVVLSFSFSFTFFWQRIHFTTKTIYSWMHEESKRGLHCTIPDPLHPFPLLTWSVNTVTGIPTHHPCSTLPPSEHKMQLKYTRQYS